MRFLFILSLVSISVFGAPPRGKEFVLLDQLKATEIEDIQKEFLTRTGWSKGEVTVDEFTGFVTSAASDDKRTGNRKPDVKVAEEFFRKVGELMGVRLLPDFMGEAQDIFESFKFTKVLGMLQHVEATVELLHYPEYVMPMGPHYDFKARLFFVDGQVERIVSQPRRELLPKVDGLELTPKYHWADAEVKAVFKGLEIEVPGKTPRKLKFKDFADMQKVQASAAGLEVRAVTKGIQLWLGLAWIFPVKLNGVEVRLIVSANKPEFIGQESDVFF